MRALSAMLSALLLAPVPTAGQSLMQAVRDDRWPQADIMAAAEPDPLAGKLVRYFRLLAPDAARAVEIADFIERNPDWPNQPLLRRRLDEALAADLDAAAVLGLCERRLPRSVPALLRCAALEAGQDPVASVRDARQAWIDGLDDPGPEAEFLARWAGDIRPEEQWARFDRLAWAGALAPAAQQILRLDPSRRPAAVARLALRQDGPAAPAMVRALPPAEQADPAMTLELARWHRRAGREQEAADIWTGAGAGAERDAAPVRQRAFWAERNRLARSRLAAGDPERAYAIAAAPAADRESALDQAFLAGWIALRKLGRPADALRHFALLDQRSASAITQARAHYWLARAHAAARDRAAAGADYEAAAAWPTTFYGQLAALALGQDPAARLDGLRDPAWDGPRALGFLRQDAARAAVLLAAWGEPRRAKAFLAELDGRAADPAARALSARLALDLGLPEQAVMIARRAGADGLMLPDAGWPAAADLLEGPIEPAVALGVMRQESSFDVQALSRSGARGLMQLMPATAAEVAGKLALPASIGALTSDPAYNVRLGTAYFAGLLDRFGQTLPLAIAGYNAGPNRVAGWLAAQPIPSAAPDDMIDWIEAIPFDETRNYVQRVIENIVVYRAKLGAAVPHPVATREGSR